MDDIDRAQHVTDNLIKEGLRKTKSKQPTFNKGSPGDCDLCGEWSGRLIQGVCAPCRDRYSLP